MKRTVASITLLVMLAGCAGIRPYDQVLPEATLDELNRALDGQAVQVTLWDGTEVWGENMTIAPDSAYISVTGRPSNQPPLEVVPRMSLPTPEIERIAVTRTGRGARRGAVRGFLMGAGMGAAIGASGEDSEALGWTIATGAAGAAIGLLLGALAGSTDIYNLSEVLKVAPGSDKRS